MGHTQELILGYPRDLTNVFRWQIVRMNLPGAADYDPTMAWVSKVREEGRVAADLFIYMDDLRPTAPDEEE
jgi:hypothetical protein